MMGKKGGSKVKGEATTANNRKHEGKQELSFAASETISKGAKRTNDEIDDIFAIAKKSKSNEVGEQPRLLLLRLVSRLCARVD